MIALPPGTSPQTVVDVLVAQSPVDGLIACGLLALTSPDPRAMWATADPNSQVYMTPMGTWSTVNGRAYSLGMSVALPNIRPSLQSVLVEQRVLTSYDKAAVPLMHHPILASMRQHYRMRNWVLFGLPAADGRLLGMVYMGTGLDVPFRREALDAFAQVMPLAATHLSHTLLADDRVLGQAQERAALDAVHDAVLHMTFYGEEPRVLTVNRAFSTLFQCPQEAVLDARLPDLLRQMTLPEAARQALWQGLTNAPLISPLRQTGTLTLDQGDGWPRDVRWESVFVPHPRGRVVVFHDETHQHATSRMQSAFLSRISHELRTPLFSIAGFAELLLEFGQDAPPDKLHEYVGLILHNARQLNTLFDNVLEITRAYGGSRGVMTLPVNLASTISAAVALVVDVAALRGQRIVLDVPSDLPLALGDTYRLPRLLTALLHNALKFAPDGGHAAIVVGHISNPPDDAPPNLTWPTLLVQVTDDGPGVPDDLTQRVFDPFYRTPMAADRRNDGAGLGLTLARTYAELLGGALWAVPTSRTHGGHFCLALKVAQDVMPPAEPRGAVSP